MKRTANFFVTQCQSESHQTLTTDESPRVELGFFKEARFFSDREGQIEIAKSILLNGAKLQPIVSVNHGT